ncbi:hypothetical protein N7522_012017 [Penicillium canescens]|nr:hypothetical protein N7522_012017 [Penicillium canescens]
MTPVPGFAANAVTIWKTGHYPAELTDIDPTVDAAGVQNYIRGSFIRLVDFPPNSTGHRHRTQSLDYAIIMSDEIQLVLDNSSTIILCQGDVVVQQSTMHQWNNLTDRYCRVVFVLLLSEGFVVGEALGDEGVPERYRFKS